MRQIYFLVAVVACCVTLGCGGGDPTIDLGSSVEITGKVSMDDKPAAGVEIIFSRQGGGAPAEASSFGATTDASGAYTISGVYFATYGVSVSEPEKGEADEEGAAALDEGPYEKYGMDSELTAVVAEGNTTFDFDLSSK